MVRIIAFLVVVAALVTLVLQNLTPVLGLVVLGQTTVELPLAVWLLGAIAVGAMCTLVMYQLVPQKKAYRPMGKRLSDPPPANRFVDSEPPIANQVQPPAGGADTGRNPYDRDWDNFRAPEQWEDWGQQSAAADYGPRDRSNMPSDDDAMRDIESGWEEEDYQASRRFVDRQEPSRPDTGWDDRDYPAEGGEQPRSYEEGWLYNNSSGVESRESVEEESPRAEEANEDVYDANYRVIIPPYDTKDS
ncbi:MAG: hypothetical protein AAF821_18000 [Cyanobacteria bacterium P01_D01_bin.156]